MRPARVSALGEQREISSCRHRGYIECLFDGADGQASLLAEHFEDETPTLSRYNRSFPVAFPAHGISFAHDQSLTKGSLRHSHTKPWAAHWPKIS